VLGNESTGQPGRGGKLEAHGERRRSGRLDDDRHPAGGAAAGAVTHLAEELVHALEIGVGLVGESGAALDFGVAPERLEEVVVAINQGHIHLGVGQMGRFPHAVQEDGGGGSAVSEIVGGAQGIKNAASGLPVPGAVHRVGHPLAEFEKSGQRYGRRGGVARGIRDAGRLEIPIRNPVGREVGEVIIGGALGRVEESRIAGLAVAMVKPWMAHAWPRAQVDSSEAPANVPRNKTAPVFPS
jgi:hypothetical protein